MKTLQLLGDKVRARALAMSAEVPIVLGSEKLDSFKDLPTRFPIILKPILGGGRGMRVVRKKEVDNGFKKVFFLRWHLM